MIISVHQPQYLPWLGYFHKISCSDTFVFLDNVQYKKREFQNRNKIRTTNGNMWLTVPVITKDKYFQKISEVEIDNTIDWRKSHLKSIESNYSNAPFFRNFFHIFEKLYGQEWTRLIDVNVNLIQNLLDVFNIHTPIVFESTLDINSVSSQRIIDICKKLNADTYLSGTGGKNYMDENLFVDNNVKIVYQDFKHPVYKQNHEGFEPYMSIIDYLFNTGSVPFK